MGKWKLKTQNLLANGMRAMGVRKPFPKSKWLYKANCTNRICYGKYNTQDNNSIH